MKARRISAEDVGRKAGVSRTTVSFVLNNTPGKSISEDTRQRVLQAAAELGYTPNEAARRLAMTRDKTIGLYISHSKSVFSDAFIMRLIEGMTQTVNRNRVRLVIHQMPLMGSNYLQLAEEDGVAGLILVNTHEDDYELQRVVDSRIPAVIMDVHESLAVDQIATDNRQGAREVVEYLISLRHSRIAMVTHARPEFTAARLRMAGYRDALKAADLGYDSSLVKTGNFTEESGYLATEELLQQSELPTAIFAGNDVVAYGVLSALRDNGIAVPQQMSVVGFDDDFLSRYLSPPLTTMVLPAAGMGATAVDMLLHRMDEDAEEQDLTRTILLPSHLVVRESAAPPNN
ncbi:LacI family DNA-binding transcriptional regulator [Spirochaeta africana]|uniref:Transcriptional regulator n=1 Tax=Spirochaeta africana (strain ATCC 700263 / DSM 8902 / Z-7692) TaxID=889378 RepID=H9ULY1_SPIAZ|nr:LacI family DNA-binding transcriptional regulator [Spirochaeta africana]AFG38524.1 transcriptional regulator [Spirochaeta africana DSM 8902]